MTFVQIYRWLPLSSHPRMSPRLCQLPTPPSRRKFSSCKNTRSIKVNNLRIGAYYVSHFLCCYILPVDSIIDAYNDHDAYILGVPWAYFHSLFSFSYPSSLCFWSHLLTNSVCTFCYMRLTPAYLLLYASVHLRCPIITFDLFFICFFLLSHPS
jgi:hypothetical protein